MKDKVIQAAKFVGWATLGTYVGMIVIRQINARLFQLPGT